MGYMGAIFLGMLALATKDPPTRARALEEGEALLAATAPSHNHLLFRKDAIDACLGCGDWDGAERHAAALEAFVTQEPLPWSSFFIARARALSACARGDASQFVELMRLSKDAERLGQKLALPAIAAALARLG
jgi:hypothetical protein